MRHSSPTPATAADERPEARPDVADILLEIADRRRQRLAVARRRELRGRELRGRELAPPDDPPRLLGPERNPFLAALARDRGRAIIAEVKLGSPRLGSLAECVDPLALARGYAAAGASALSVVVEPDYFHGSYELLAACHEASGLPAIAKDFVVDPLQLHWAKRAGASAVLLVASLHGREELLELAAYARGLGLAPLVETHDLADLMKLEGELWELVGINNRNLRTFEVEIGNSLALLPSLPTAALKVAESGIASPEDLALLKGAGFDAYLVGETLITAEDPGARLAELRGGLA